MSAMTFDQWWDWEQAECKSREQVARWAWDESRRYITQPAQAVDVLGIYPVGYFIETRAGEYGRVSRQHEGDDDVFQLYRALTGEKAGRVDGWISVKERLPERNKPAIYWHKSDFGGFAAIADEWRDEHHLAQATHWMPYIAPAPPAPDKEGM